MLKSAIILVGGKGSRFSDIKSLPKHLALINGEPIMKTMIIEVKVANPVLTVRYLKILKKENVSIKFKKRL